VGIARGTLKPNEEPEKAAARECHERSDCCPDASKNSARTFRRRVCDEEMTSTRRRDYAKPGPDDEKAAAGRRRGHREAAFSIEQIRAMIRSGEIIDMKTVAGLSLL
jgi:hypothetical protein